jgi:hypothetical protein
MRLPEQSVGPERMHMPEVRPTRAALVAVVALAAALAGVVTVSVRGEAHAGERLFDGRHPLAGGLAHHPQPLPAEALRCVNCHARSDRLEAGFAPVLSAASITRAAERRGGPASRYDRTAFCRVLRTGIDPAWVLVSRAMPRYALTDAQCAALWTYLTEGDA